MERTKGRVLRRCCVAALALFVVSLACLAWAGVYNKCRVPPIVASVEKPNVMMLIDFSGSMQYAPYYGYDGRTWAYYYSTGVIDQYDETYQPDGGGPAICRYDKYRDYYGFFDPGGYYRYNSTGDYFEVFTPTGTVGTSVRTYTIKEIKIDIQDYSDAGGAKIYRAYFKYALASGGTAIAVDECVFLRDVDKQSALLSNKAFRVIAVGTVGTDNYFAVYFTPSRDGDPPTTDYIACAGSATTRVTGNFTNGISGNFLNFAAMSRMDNTLTALIGGKAQCNTETECATSDDTCHCYIRGQGGRRNARDTTALHVDVYTRAGDYTSASDWRPNNYNTGNSYKDKYSFLSVSTHNHGTLTPADPISFKGDGQAELWTFTMSRQTRIFIEMRKDVVDSKKARIRLYNGSTPAGDPLGTWTANGVFNPNDAEISNGSTRTARDNGYLLNAGTYCVEATCETALAGSDTLGYTLVINADVTKSTHAAHDGETRSTTGAFTAGRVVLKKDKALRSGIIQDTFGRVRYGFAYFQGSTQGKIVVGCDNTDQDALVDALQSNTTATSTLYPYGGTPTGEAMWEMYKYYKQESSVDGRSYVNNGAFISKGGSVDPYYSSGSLTPCRRSFVLLISDGAWNGSQDPVVPAYRMHINDIRTDSGLSGTQSVNVYTVYTYSTDQLGQNSMKEIAMYGGFQDLPDSAGVKDNYPYTANRGTALPSTSLNLDWPLKGCSKCVTGSWCTSACLKNCCPLAHECPSAGGACQTYTCSGSSKFFDPSWAGPNGTYSTQCAEWAFETMQQMPPDPSNPVYTDGNAKRTIYGEPRTYFYSSSGTEISDALTRIIGEIESAHAAAGAVATVSQEIRGFDIVLRGVFQAVDETDPARSVWYGHLEAYSPYADGTYSFEKCCNEDKLCYQDSGSACDGEDCPSARNCWDAAQILTSTTRGRIFAGYDLNSNGKIERNEVKDFTTANASYFRPLLNLQAANDCDHNGTLNNTDAAELISWIRGNASTCYRSRIDTVDTSKTWLMGDVAYSTPVIVGVPSLGAVSRMDPNITEYLTFRNNQLSKQETPPSGVNTASPTLAQVMKKVVYVGANDGQLHAFVFGVWDWRNQKWVYEYNSSDAYGKYIGQELWAYIPSNLVSELKDLAAISYGNTGCKHRTMVDLSPQAWHVYIDHDGSAATPKQWRTVLLGGERGGGDVYFAVDVTDPDNPVLLWEYSVLKNLIYYQFAPYIPWTSNQGHCNDTNKGNFCERCVDKCRPTDRNPGNPWVNFCRNRVDWCTGLTTPTCTNAHHSLICTVPFEGYKIAGFKNNYDAWKAMAFSWSRPTVGRFKSLDGKGVTMYWDDPIPESQSNSGDPTGTFPNTSTGFSGDRHLAFIGGGFRYYDTQLDASTNARDLELLRQPYFMAIDVETGRNLFRYVWASLIRLAPSTHFDMFPLLTRGGGAYYIPHALNDPLALDVLDKRNPAAITVGDDGYVDHVYVGDLAGNFYGFKFNFETGTTKGIWVDMWLTKAVTETDSSLASKWSYFRSYGQPITVQPAASIDPDLQSLRLVLGTGKYDDVIAGRDDKTDPAKMSLYNLKDTLAQPSIDTTTDFGGEIVDGSGLWLRFNPKCGDPSSTARLAKFDTSCAWMKSTGVYDCCERNNADCANPCWKCIYDLALPSTSGQPGERITSKALIAGKLILVTSFLPPADPCAFTGQGYLYIFQYACSAFPDGFNPLTDPGDRLLAFYINKPGSSTDVLGLRLPLGAGMPSEPILDSSGKHVLIQMSTAEIKKIGVELIEKPFAFKGWRETTQ